jgi:hypothetical protein
MICAEVHSDDYVRQVKFDATKWFESASDQEIINLINCDFGGDYPADRVAENLSVFNQELSDFFSYFDDKPVMLNGDTVGFECHVNVNEAESWIKNNRPNLKEYLDAK